MSDHGRRLAVLPAAAVLGLALTVVACGDRAAPSSSGSPTPTPPSSSSGSPPPTPVAVVPIGSGPLVIDAGLLHVLPDEVAGVQRGSADVAALAMIADPALGRSASGIAVGVFAVPGSSDDDDLAVATVVQLRPGINGDTFFKDWRTDYDRSACEPAGGVKSHAQRVIGSHTVEVTVCGEGVQLYHTRLSGDRLVSITAVGDRNLGDLVMAGLRE